MVTTVTFIPLTIFMPTVRTSPALASDVFARS